jgi:hypothetical protein
MKRIIYQSQNGDIAIVVPADKQKPNETESAYLDRIAARAESQFTIPMTRVATIDHTELPDDRRWRDSWEWQTDRVVLSLAKIRTIRIK